MEKPIVKYYINGEYKEATVSDVGDISKLKTSVRTDLVSAINSILNGEINAPAEVDDKINKLKKEISTLVSELEKLGVSVDGIQGNVEKTLEQKEKESLEAINKITTDLSKNLNKTIDDAIAEFKEGYEEVKVAQGNYDKEAKLINEKVESAYSKIGETEEKLNKTSEELQTIGLNVRETDLKIDEINGNLEKYTKVTDFDLVEAAVKKHEQKIIVNEKEISKMAKKSDLDNATGRVSELETKITETSEELKAKASKEEVRKEIEKIDKYGHNLLRDTRDWATWEKPNASDVEVSNDTYKHRHKAKLNKENAWISQEVDGLIIGETYTVSVMAKSSSEDSRVVMSTKKDNITMSDFAGTDSIHSNFQRMSASFVASSEADIITFKASKLPVGQSIELVGGKLEKGDKASPWQPHIDDIYEKSIKQDTEIKLASDGLKVNSEAIEKTNNKIKETSTKLDVLSDGISQHSEKIEKINKDVVKVATDLKSIAGEVSSKINKTQLDDRISELDVDSTNMILNSCFTMDMLKWASTDSLFKLEEIDGLKYATVERSGSTKDYISSISSNKFPVVNGDKLSISFDLIVKSIAQLDNKNIAYIELFDISNKRLTRKEFKLSDFKGDIKDGIPKRLSLNYIVDNELAAKASLSLALYRNGKLSFTRISVSKGEITSKTWTPSSEDANLIATSLQTEIKQKADGVIVESVKEQINAVNKDLSVSKSKWESSSEKILQQISTINKDKMSKSEYEQSAKGVTEKITSLSGKVDGVSLKTNQLEKTATGMSNKITQIETGQSKLSKDVNNKIDNISVGGRNLVLDSSQSVSSKEYFIKSYDLSEDWIVGQEYTVTIWGEINDNQSFGIWANGSGSKVGGAFKVRNGLYVGKFTVATAPNVGGVNSGKGKLNVYNYPIDKAKFAKINKIKLEKGNVVGDWSPAPEDLIDSGRNLFRYSDVKNADLVDIPTITFRDWAGDLISNSDLNKILEPDTEYKIQYGYRLDEDNRKNFPKISSQPNHGTILLYSGVDGNPHITLGGAGGNNVKEMDAMKVGDILYRKATFRTPKNLKDPKANYRLIKYSTRRTTTDDKSSNHAKGSFVNIKIEKSIAHTSWSPAPEDRDLSLNVGGRNMILDSRTFTGYLSGDLGVATQTVGEKTTDFIDIRGCKNLMFTSYPLSNIDNGVTWNAYALYDKDKKVISGRPTFLSGIKLQKGVSIRQVYDFTNEIQKYPNAAYIRLSSSWIEDGKWKLEDSSVPTDWSPSPEDSAHNNLGGENILFNSSFERDIEGWESLLTDVSHRVVDGEKCIAHKSHIGKTTLILQDITNRIKLHTDYVIGVDVNIKNLKKGTTNPYVAIYLSGTNMKDEWLGYTRIPPYDIDTLYHCNNKGWVRVYMTCRFDVPFKRMNINLYSRDADADIAYKNFKMEEGLKPTPWRESIETINHRIENHVNGGVNLIKDSNDFSTYNGYSGAEFTVQGGVTVEEWRAKDASRIILDKDKKGSNVVKILKNVTSAPLPKNEKVVNSVYIKNNGTKDILYGTNYGEEVVKPKESKRVVVQSVGNGFGYLQSRFDTLSPTDDLDITVWHDQAESGTFVSDWKPSQETLLADIENMSTKIYNVEQKVDAKSIINTITESEYFQDLLNQKADSNELEGMAREEALEKAMEDIRSEIELSAENVLNKGSEIFIKNSEMKQLVDKIMFSITQAGGVNLLRNSVGYAGTDYWEATAGFSTIQNEELSSLGYGSGWIANGKAKGQINLDQMLSLPAGTYTISYSSKVSKGSCGIRIRFNGTWDFKYVNDSTVNTGGNYIQKSITFTTKGETVGIRIFATDSSEVTISGVMLNEGSQALSWQPHNTEIYNTNVLIDSAGLRVFNNKTSGYTIVTPDEFAGYAMVAGVMERVFSVNDQVTFVKKLRVGKEVAVGNIKMLHVTNPATKHDGVAFVPNR